MFTKAKFSLTVLVIISIVLAAGTAFAVDLSKAKTAAGTTNFPYLAQPVSANVNIRSGAGLAFYPCGKLKVGEDITVVSEEFGWAKISPPKGSFSWIAKQFIKVDPDNPKVGFVKGEKSPDEEIRVWAGSPDYDALTSSTTQTKLSEKRFDVVELLGVEESDYLKIAPPAGAFLYVHADNLKYIGPVGAIPAPEKKQPTVKPGVADPVSADDDNNNVTSTRALPLPTLKRTPETKRLIIKCRGIADLAEAEKEKPFMQQDYTELKESVAQIAEGTSSTQAKAYAEYLTKLIRRYELVVMIEKELVDHAAILAKRKQEIEEKFKQRNRDFVDPSKYVAKGTFRPSSVFKGGQRHYIIIGDDNKISCYAKSGNYITEKVLKTFYDKKVGLVGTVTDKSFGTVCVVKFSGIENID